MIEDLAEAVFIVRFYLSATNTAVCSSKISTGLIFCLRDMFENCCKIFALYIKEHFG